MPLSNGERRVVPTRSGVQYSPEQWAAKKDIITQLYAVEGKPLREVKEFLLTRYDFRPTDRMYQRKIAQWKIDKKHKAPEMRAILRLARQHEAAGLQSVFRIRGRRVDIEEVHRYFRRRGEDPNRVDVGDSQIPSAITVDTPAPAPEGPAEDANEDDFAEFSYVVPTLSTAASYSTSETEYFSTSAASSSSASSTRSDSVVSTPVVFSGGTLACQMIPNYPNMAVPIDVTFEDQCFRILLHLTQMYFDGVVRPKYFSQELSNRVIRQPWRRTLSSWSRATSEGNELLQRGQTRESFDLRDRAMASVPKHIKNKSPIILFRYFEIIYHISASPEDQPFLLLTLNHVLNMARIILPPGHPIGQLTQLLLHPRVRPIIRQLAQQGIRKCLQLLFDRCGPRHPRILYVLDSRTQTFLDEHQYEQASKEAALYLERAELIRGDHSFDACQAHRMLGDAYVGQGELGKAAAEYGKALFLQSHLADGKDRGVIGVRVKRGLAGIARLRGEYVLAGEHLRGALDMATVAFGEGDVQSVLVRKDLDALGEVVGRVNMEGGAGAGLPIRLVDV